MSKLKSTTTKTKVKPGTTKNDANERKRLFAEAFMSNGGNRTEAAKQLGYSEKSAAKQGSRMSKDPYVLSIIDQRQAELAQKYELTTESIIQELSKIVHADLRKLFNEDGTLKETSAWPDDVASAIGSVEINELFDGNGKDRKLIGYTKKLKLWDKNSALEKAMKHLGMFEKDNDQSRPVTKIVMVPAKRAKDDC